MTRANELLKTLCDQLTRRDGQRETARLLGIACKKCNSPRQPRTREWNLFTGGRSGLRVDGEAEAGPGQAVVADVGHAAHLEPFPAALAFGVGDEEL
jgi:hypothetical protein